jgi:hypothetical protein
MTKIFLLISALLIVLSVTLAVGVIVRMRELHYATHVSDYLMPLIVFLPLMLGLHGYRRIRRTVAATNDMNLLPLIQYALISVIGGAYAAIALAISWLAMFLKNS